MLRCKEVLHYLASSCAGGSIPKPSCPDPGECFKMSEDLGDYVNLLTFTTIPHGAAQDPARKVCNLNHSPLLTDPHPDSHHYLGLCEEAEELYPTVDINARSLHYII